VELELVKLKKLYLINQIKDYSILIKIILKYVKLNFDYLSILKIINLKEIKDKLFDKMIKNEKLFYGYHKNCSMDIIKIVLWIS